MSEDKIDDLLAIGGAFDWITPLHNWLSGYNEGIPVNSREEAVIVQEALKNKGVKSRIEGDLFSGYRVMWKK